MKSLGRCQARIRVLRQTDFYANVGEMTFFVGPPGCGRTTLISIIQAILNCHEGKLEVLGTRLTKLPRAWLINWRCCGFSGS